MYKHFQNYIKTDDRYKVEDDCHFKEQIQFLALLVGYLMYRSLFHCIKSQKIQVLLFHWLYWLYLFASFQGYLYHTVDSVPVSIAIFQLFHGFTV